VKSKTVAKPERMGELADGGEGASIDEPGKRPLLTLQGTPAIERTSSSSEASSTWTADPSEPRPSALDPQARASYKSAYRTFQDKKPREALDAFAAFVLKYPDHPYVEQATYWRGECYVALGDTPHALEQFRGVVARFPGTPKAHEAEGRIATLRGDKGASR
jgi:TolA-binding protein